MRSGKRRCILEQFGNRAPERGEEGRWRKGELEKVGDEDEDENEDNNDNRNNNEYNKDDNNNNLIMIIIITIILAII